MRIVYLDQNKWIELAKSAKEPDKYPELATLLHTMIKDVQAGGLILPLTLSNIYETHKINDASRRHDLASLQALLSRGLVFRGRYRRLEAELADLLRAIYALPAETRDPLWFLSNIFFEAFAEVGDPRLKFTVSDGLLNFLRKHPAYGLYDYLFALPEEIRLAAVQKFSAGSEQLRIRVENRRTQHSGESLAMRRRIYGALLMIDELETIMQVAAKVGVSWRTVSDIGSSNARRIMRDVPLYNIERELTLRLESQYRPIEENDFRDMQSFCAVLPYANHVIAENQFINLAKQAKLDQRYATYLSTDIFEHSRTASTRSR